MSAPEKKLKRWNVGGRITGAVSIGFVHAATEKEAIELGWQLYHEGKYDADSVEWDVDRIEADPEDE